MIYFDCLFFQDNIANSIANIKFEDIFSGDIPQFSETKKNKALAKNGLTKKCNKLINGESSKKDEKAMLEMVEKLKEEKLKIKEKRKEEKEKLSKFMKEWNKKKEDLELENLKVIIILKINAKYKNNFLIIIVSVAFLNFIIFNICYCRKNQY